MGEVVGPDLAAGGRSWGALTTSTEVRDARAYFDDIAPRDKKLRRGALFKRKVHVCGSGPLFWPAITWRFHNMESPVMGHDKDQIRMGCTHTSQSKVYGAESV